MSKKITITTLIMLALILILSGGVQAYSSMPTGTATMKTVAVWIQAIRQFESVTAGMGLTETLDTTTYLSSSESNNIDVHMQKNTEYGAMALLSASAYGKQGNGTEGSNYVHTSDYGLATSTGNSYGVYELGSAEMVVGGVSESGGITSSTVGIYSKSNTIDSRYKNLYTSSASNTKTGDAVAQRTWHGGGSSWLYVNTTASTLPQLIRGVNSVFGTASTKISTSSSTRVVIVSGEGF